MPWTGDVFERGARLQVARVTVGIALLIIVLGIWACLWVPPWPVF